MRRTPLWLFLLIFLIAVWAILINLPKQLEVGFDINKIFPFLNHSKKLTANHTLILPNLSNLLNLAHISTDYSLHKGLDLQGGTSITLRADMNKIPSSERDDALESAKTVIERRINFFGVSEPVVETAKTSKDYRIIVEIPGISDVTQAVQLIGQTAKLTFWEAGPASASTSAQTASPSANLPVGITQVVGTNPHETDLSGTDLKNATVGFNQQSGQPEVLLQFSDKGAKKFADITKKNIGKYVAMVLDNVIVSAPRVNEVIPNGNASITGNFTVEQAKALAIQLNAGALPVPLSILQQRAVGSTLGEASLKASLFAGILGFVIIVAFMIGLYGRLGITASVALVLYTLVVLGIFRMVSVTLTLAGIAGFILSIGIAVDANILIFERTREELRKGHSWQRALDLGFTRAWTSIRDSNAASLITSAILYYFGTGIIRGFALTLAIGVIVSLFSAVVVTRTLLRSFYKG